MSSFGLCEAAPRIRASSGSKASILRLRSTQDVMRAKRREEKPRRGALRLLCSGLFLLAQVSTCSDGTSENTSCRAQSGVQQPASQSSRSVNLVVVARPNGSRGRQES